MFRRGAERNIQTVIDVLGDRPIDAYSSSDAASLRDYLLGNGLTTNSVKRNFSTIRSIINLCIQEHGLDCRNAFSPKRLGFLFRWGLPADRPFVARVLRNRSRSITPCLLMTQASGELG